MGVGNGIEVTSMHNVWFELLVNGGVPFFLPFVIWYAKLAWELFRHARSLLQRRPRLAYYCGALSLGMVGFVPAAVSASSTIYNLPYYTMLGMAIAMVHIVRSEAATAARPGVRQPASSARGGSPPRIASPIRPLPRRGVTPRYPLRPNA
jgi:hypothetical protein